MKFTRLGDLLIDAGVITDEQLGQALANQKKTKRRLGDELVQSGIITERQVVDALTMQLGIDFIDLTTTDIAPEMTKLVPKNLAKRYNVVPVKTRGDELYLAMSDPLNFIATEEVRAASRKRIVPMIAMQSGIDHAISQLYGSEGAKRAIREMQQEVGESGRERSGVQVSEVGVDNESSAPSIRLVDNIIERGLSTRASDIHIEPMENEVVVRMRIDGLLHTEFNIPKELQSSLTSRVKVMCNMDVTERRIPQDGRAIVRVRMREADLRVSTLPTVHGEKIVMRILDRDKKLNTPEQLGFMGTNLERYNYLLGLKQGIVLLVGPTGSGKSSTLFTMIDRLNVEEVNIVTLEDPVEFNIEGVNQVQINEKTGTTFASGLRSILRQDPDIISIGEIRDQETADIAFRSAVTGHFVLSTLHTNSAVATLDRLDDIGVEPYMIGTALKGVISQRLVRRICPYCKQEHPATEEEIEALGLDPDMPENKGLMFAHGRGCAECYQSGYRGRIVVVETLVMDKHIRKAIMTHASRDELNEAVRRSGFEPVIENCRALVKQGITTVEEVQRVVFSDDE